DLRERALARADAGETIREIAAALSISPSCVSKWRKRLRETGTVSPGCESASKWNPMLNINSFIDMVGEFGR
ncbi:MAG: helix-turn-helix domain-containing protein, partial [Alphaproteobacteria bacterium]|nr:helix-turn-helix domain-containing protein [Alphaproteobacteria bacterium]